MWNKSNNRNSNEIILAIKMMRALIIDDEKIARNTLKSDVEAYCPDINIIGEADGVKAGTAAIIELKPDLVFLDVEMQDGTGFDVLEALKPISFKVIFTTAHNGYAIRAFKYSAVDYLLKPVDSDELIEAIKKINSISVTSLLQNSLNVLLENTRNTKKETQKIVISTTDGHSIFTINEVIRFEADRNYTKVFIVHEKPLLVAKTLKHFEDVLKDQNFERVHQSHYVNIQHIKKYISRDGGYLIMSDKSNVPVAQRKKTELLALLESL